MNFLGNLLWILFGGLFSAIGWCISGVLLCITVVGIPFGVQCFKIAGLVLMPFGKDVRIGNFGAFGLLGNIVWIVLVGWALCLHHLFWGILLSITIVGIPFGKQHFKLAKLALVPFGAEY